MDAMVSSISTTEAEEAEKGGRVLLIIRACSGVIISFTFYGQRSHVIVQLYIHTCIYIVRWPILTEPENMKHI